MNRTILKVLADRTQLALGSLALVDKQLLEISSVVDDLIEKLHHEDTRGQEEKLDSDFFITPPLEVYDDAD